MAEVACTVCGAEAAEAPLTWTLQVTEQGPRWVCASCTREHVRAIEAKLDDAWW